MNTLMNAGGESRQPDERGVAMILVLGWSVLLMALALVVVQAVVRQIVPSNRSENSFAALAAAEAGIDDYKARVAQAPNYYLTADTSTGAFAGFVPVPGGNTTSSYTYAIDSSRAATLTPSPSRSWFFTTTSPRFIPMRKRNW